MSPLFVICFDFSVNIVLKFFLKLKMLLKLMSFRNCLTKQLNINKSINNCLTNVLKQKQTLLLRQFSSITGSGLEIIILI